MLIRPIVANVDYLAIQFAAKHPNIDFERINLLLLTSFYYKVKPIVIVNKIDYLTEEELNELKEKLSFLEKVIVYPWCTQEEKKKHSILVLLMFSNFIFIILLQ